MESLVTDVVTLTFRDDRIVEMVEKDDATIDTEAFISSMDLISRHASYPTVVLARTRKPFFISPDTYQKISRARPLVALAVVQPKSTGKRSKFTNIQPRDQAYPVMFFDNKEYATAWLQRQVYIHLMYPRQGSGEKKNRVDRGTPSVE